MLVPGFDGHNAIKIKHNWLSMSNVYQMMKMYIDFKVKVDVSLGGPRMAFTKVLDIKSATV